MRDKAVREMLTALAPAAASIVCATAPSARAMTADELAELAGSLGLRAEAIADPIEAVTRACGDGRTGRRRGVDLPDWAGPELAGP